MPDPNKFAKLAEVNYQIRKCCGFCLYRQFKTVREAWGYCERHGYLHGKHTGESRLLGIHRTGCCKDFVLDGAALDASTESYAALLESTKPR